MLVLTVTFGIVCILQWVYIQNRQDVIDLLQDENKIYIDEHNRLNEHIMDTLQESIEVVEDSKLDVDTTLKLTNIWHSWKLFYLTKKS